MFLQNKKGSTDTEFSGSIIPLGNGCFRLMFDNVTKTNRSGGIAFGSARRYALGSGFGFMGVFHDTYATSRKVAVPNPLSMVIQTFENSLRIVQAPSEFMRCREPVLVKRSQVPSSKAMVPLGFAKVSPVLFSWMTVSVFLNNFLR